MKFKETSLPGVLVVEPTVHGDSRGYFMEVYHQKRFREAGIDVQFVQDNASRSVRGALRGLHYQEPQGQGKVVRATAGAVFDVAVDVRRGSPHFGRWFGIELSEENRLQLWVPAGFAHGFVVMSESADFCYKCTDLYAPEHEHGILWNDPAIGVKWPIAEPVLSARDRAFPHLADAKTLPIYCP